MEQSDQAEMLAQNTAFMAACAARKTGENLPIVRGTAWVGTLPDKERKELLSLVFNYDAWTPETDPTGTHASGVIQFKGHFIIWTIGLRCMDAPGIMTLNPPAMCLTVSHSSEVR